MTWFFLPLPWLRPDFFYPCPDYDLIFFTFALITTWFFLPLPWLRPDFFHSCPDYDLIFFLLSWFWPDYFFNVLILTWFFWPLPWLWPDFFHSCPDYALKIFRVSWFGPDFFSLVLILTWFFFVCPDNALIMPWICPDNALIFFSKNGLILEIAPYRWEKYCLFIKWKCLKELFMRRWTSGNLRLTRSLMKTTIPLYGADPVASV